MPKNQEKRSKQDVKDDKMKFNSKSIKVKDAEEGSLLIWTKISKACFISKQAFKDAIAEFLATIFKENPTEGASITDVTVTVHFIDKGLLQGTSFVVYCCCYPFLYKAIDKAMLSTDIDAS